METLPKLRFLTAATLMLVACLATTGAAQTVTLFDVPDGLATAPSSINNRGDVTGSYVQGTTVASQPLYHGFVRARAGNITVFDAPNSNSTIPVAINDSGQIAGYFAERGNDLVRGFVRDQAGNITVFDVPDPGKPGAGKTSTFAAAMNSSGDITGWVIDSTSARHGFVRVHTGTTAIFDAPGAVPAMGTFPIGINDQGEITGEYFDNSVLTSHGFVRDANGAFTIIDPAGFGLTSPNAINSRGDVVGFAFPDGNPNNAGLGFVRDREGAFTFLTPSAGLQVFPYAINTQGNIAGYITSDGSPFFSAFIGDRAGNITILDRPADPDAIGMFSIAINERGDVAGYVIDACTAVCPGHGFVRTRTNLRRDRKANGEHGRMKTYW